MWTRQRLEELAEAERRLYADARFARLATAMARHKGETYEHLPPEAETSAELQAALAAVSVEDIKAHPRHTGTEATLAEMLALKQRQPAPSQAPTRAQTPPNVPSPILQDEHDEDAEPQM